MPEPEESAKPNPDVKDLQAKLETLQAKLTAAKEPVVIEALQAKIMEIATELGPEVAAAAEAKSKEAKPKKKELEDLVLPDPPTPEQELQADELVRRARVAKMRGQVQEATSLIQQAARVAPGSALVQEMLGDELMDRKLVGDARRAYLIAHRLDPHNAAIERKYAQTVLRTSAIMSVENALALGLDSPFMNPNETLANAKFAVFLSLILPGVGQLVLGQTQKGLILIGSYVAGIIMLVLMHEDFVNLTRMFSGAQHSGSAGFSLIPLAGLLIVMIIAVQGCASKAKKEPLSAARHIERPTPPVNLPFE